MIAGSLPAGTGHDITTLTSVGMADHPGDARDTPG